MTRDDFATARRGVDETNPSPSDAELVELIARHGEQEGRILNRYARFAAESDSAAVRYLVSMLMDDEHRHHRILGELANTIAWVVPNSDAPVPLPEAPPINDLALAMETADLIEAEERDRRELEVLRKKLDRYSGTTIWPLLIDLMMLDTSKHIRILRFIQSLYA